MYAFSIALALQNIHMSLPAVPESPFIVEPPADEMLGDAAMYHYTFGSVFLDNNQSIIFDFDKRAFVDAKHMYKVNNKLVSAQRSSISMRIQT